MEIQKNGVPLNYQNDNIMQTEKTFQYFEVVNNGSTIIEITDIKKTNDISGAFKYVVCFNFTQDYTYVQQCEIRFFVHDNSRKNARYPDLRVIKVYLTILQKDVDPAALCNMGLFVERKSQYLLDQLIRHIDKPGVHETIS